MRPSRRIPSLEEQCLVQLSHYETHNTLENVRKLRDIALVCKLGNFQIPLLLNVTCHLHLLTKGFIHQFRLAPTRPGEDFIHFVGTVNHEPTHIYIQESSSNNVVTVTVATVESNHDVEFAFLTNNSFDVGYFVVDYLNKNRIELFPFAG
jgi:hypothetical protein